MLCKMKSKTKLYLALLAVGLVSLAFGVIGYLTSGNQSHHMDTLLGMFSGFGFGLLAVAVVQLIRAKRMSPEKRAEKDIEKNDERNIAVTRAAHAVGNTAGAATLVVLSFLLMFLDYRVPSYLCIGALYVQLFAFLIAYRVYYKKM